MKKKVIAAGHIALDITPVFPEQKAGKVSDIMIPGKLLHMNGVKVNTGGSVTNTGLALKILGADVTLMGKIGADAFGGIVQSVLEEYHLKQDIMVSEEAATSYTVAVAIPGIDRIFLHDPGANDTFGCDDIDYEKVEEAALFHFGYPSIMRKMYQNDGKELLEMFRRVKERNTATSLDLAAVDEKSEAGKVDWENILDRTLPYVDFFVPSVEELCFMLDRHRYEEWSERAAGKDMTEILTPDDVKPLAEKAISMGAKVALIKCGALGMYYKTAARGQMEFLCKTLDLDIEAWAEKESFENSFVPEKILSATGAGDTSIAAFLVSILEGCGIEEAVQMALATGACCLTGYDALSGLKPLSELRKKIGQGWPRNEFTIE